MTVGGVLSEMRELGLEPGQRFMVGQQSQLLHFGEDGRIYTEDGQALRRGLQEAIIKAGSIVVPTDYVGRCGG